MIQRKSLVLAVVLGSAACDGKTGTYHVSLVTAPGSHVLDAVTHAKLELTDPLTIVEADRGGDGTFALDLDVDAHGTNAYLVFLGQDATGAVVAWGQTPILPVAAIDATIAIDVAPPQSMTTSPVALDPPRADLAVAPLAYGALFAGGTDATGAARGDVIVYDAYAHVLQKGLDLPAPRASMSATTGSTGFADLFGGNDANGAPTATYWRFDTTVAPAGQYLDLTDKSSPSYARAGAAMTPIGAEVFVVAGAPPIVLDGTTLQTAAVATPPMIDGRAASVIVGAEEQAVFVGAGAGATGVAILAPSGYTELAAPADAKRTGHGVVATPSGVVIAIGGSIAGAPVASAIEVDPSAKTATSIAGALDTPRTDAAVATVGTYLLVAGGTDAGGHVLGDAELLDLPAVTHRVTIPLVTARTGARAIALPNGQILVAGGRDASGAPVGTLELFTAPAPTPTP